MHKATMGSIRPNWSWKPDSKLRLHRNPESLTQEKMMATKKTVKKTPAKAAKKKAVTATPSTDGLIPLKAVCAGLKVDPRSARRRLRKAGLAGHEARDRWSFKPGSTLLEKVTALLGASEAA